MFAGLGRFIVRRKKSVLIVFIIGILAAGGVGSLAFSKLDSGGYSDLNSDSAKLNTTKTQPTPAPAPTPKAD